MTESSTRAGSRTGRHGCALVLVLVAGLLAMGCATLNSEEQAKQIALAAAIRDVGIDHLSQGRTALSLRKLEEARLMNPEDPVTYLWLGEAFRRKGLLEKAEANFVRALELSPDKTDFNYQETLLNLSALQIQLKRYEEAIANCDLLIDDPTFATPWRGLTNRGWAEFKIGRIDDARRSYLEALDFHHTYSPAHFNLGILEQQAKRMIEALRRFELAIEGQRMGPDAIAEANYRMAEIYVAVGRRSKAIEHFSVALEVSPYGSLAADSKT
jgi:tetratricopeptide (TPR) repeat protein